MNVDVQPFRGRSFTGSAVKRLYAAQDWWPERTPEQIDAVLRSHPAVGAWKGDRLIGFARALSDGYFRAYIEDVVVDPHYRGDGVGRRLVDVLTSQLADIGVTSLFCAPEHVSLYEGAGFTFTRQRVGHISAAG